MSAVGRRWATVRTLAAVLTLGCAFAGCDPSPGLAPSAAGSPGVTVGPGPTEPAELAALRARPLLWPTVAAPDACPVTQPAPPDPAPPQDHPLSTGAAASAFGGAPIFPDARYFDGADHQLLVGAEGAEPGWYIAKVPWASRIGYRGWALIRIGRVDGQGEGRLSLQTQPAQASTGDGVHVQVVADWQFWPGSTHVTGSGCYAYQVDGSDFSEVIVFRAEVLP